MSVILIAGANRGLGLEFARQYAAEGWQVLATARAPERAEALAALPGAVTLLPLDTTRAESVAALAARLAGQPIDVLICCAGLYGAHGEQPGSFDYEGWKQVLDTNTLGPVRVAEALLPNLRAGKQRKLVALSSLMGSITDNTTGGSHAYRASKAGLNAVWKSLAIELRPEGFTVVVVHPGWVRTDMGGPAAPLEPLNSVAGLRRVIDRLTREDSGRFLNHDGRELPW
jgi:NAD(P)-dependent dehydrogenase (short-subunit alcohol dehydrogenase family)